MKRHLVTILKFGVSIAILTYLFWQANQDQQFQQLYDTKKNWGWLLLAFGACTAAHVISYYRWHIMANAIGFSLSAWEAIKIGFIGTFFNILAFGVVGGDSLRAFYAARQARSKIPEAISSVFADRVVGLMTMFGVAIVAFNLKDFSNIDPIHKHKFDAIQSALKLATIAFSLGLAGFVVLFFIPKIRERKLFQRLESVKRIGPLVTRLMDVVQLYRQCPMAIVKCFLYSVVTNTFFAITIYAMARGIVNSYPSFANHFIIAPISMVANAVPLPGGLGGMEFALNFLYQGFSNESVPSENGFVVAIGFRFALLLISVLGCVFWFVYRRQDSLDSQSIEAAA